MKNYIVNRTIRNKYHHGFARPDSDVTHFIIHGTAGGNSSQGCINWMLSGGKLANGKYRREQYEKGIALFHYIIDLDGTIYEIINPHNYVFHSSTGRFDKFTVGVELVNPDRENGGFYANEQYKSLADLYDFLKPIFTNMKKIYGHGALKFLKTGKTKKCPGTGFDWNAFSFLLKKYNHNLKNENIEVI